MKNLLFAILLFPSYLYCENRQSNIDSLQKVLKTQKSDTGRVNTLIELSSQLYQMDSYSEALGYANEAKELSKQLEFKSGLAGAQRRIGAIYTEQGKYPQAVESLLNSMHIYETTKNNYGIFLVNGNLGTIYYFQKDYDKALEYFFKANAYKNDDAGTCANIGMVYGELNPLLSLNYYLKALNYYQLNLDKNGISSMLNNIGNTYEKDNKNDSALVYYFKALKIKEEVQDNQGICEELGGIGDIYQKQKKYIKALKYEERSLSIAKQIGYLSCIKQTEEILSNIYYYIGNPYKSLDHYRQFIIVKDSMFNEEGTKRTVRAEKDFEFQKKEDIAKAEQDKKDAIQSEKLKAQRFQKNVFILGFSLVAIFLVVLFRGFKKLQQAKQIIEEQKKIVEHKNKEVTDNITYAQRIQLAMLPSNEYINNSLQNNFIIYRPKDIVSGDFYWMYDDGVNKYFATADCTGHGVSGALLTTIGTSLLNEIVIERRITSPELVLNALRDEIIKSLNKQGASEERKDGMDISFCKITGMKLECASANNSIYIIRDKQVIEIRANRFPVGKYIGTESFTLNSFDLKEGDITYTMSDGFCDQFGGNPEKKLMSKRFKQWAIEISYIQDMNEMRNELQNRFNNWIGNVEQTDDVTVFAVKI